jgi:uncharacterized membrane protein
MDSIDKKHAGRVALGLGLAAIGVSHLTVARRAFQAQVPDWVPLDKDTTVVLSGYVEIAMGLSLAFAPERYQERLGQFAAAFFTAVFPGNVSQYTHHRDMPGLDTDGKRLARLFLQAPLIYATLKATAKDKE